MTEQVSDRPDLPVVDHGGGEFKPTARSEMTEGLGWMVLGIAILIGSLLMDRLKEQDINPYTIPGLLPALLGIAMTALGFLVFIRKWTRFKGVVAARAPLSVDKRTAMNRMLLVLGICVIFCAGLLGRGLPYWLTGGVFVTACILLLDNRRRAAGEGRFTSGKIVRAAVIGFVASIAITLVFEQIFMIRLP